MRIFLLLSGLSLYTTYIYAQSFSIKSGLSVNSILHPDFQSGAIVEPGLGWTIGVLLPIVKWQHISVNTGVEIIEKNYSWHRTGLYADVGESHKNTYLSIPLYLQAPVVQLKKIKILVNAGVVYSYWLARKTDGVTPNAFDTNETLSPEGGVVQNFYLTPYTIRNDFHSGRDNRHELSISGGLRLMYQNSSKMIPELGVHYYQGINSLMRGLSSSSFRSINSTFTICAGVSLKIK